MKVRYHPPVKRSVEIAGHKTSISLEPVFWEALRLCAATRGVPINALVAEIDLERISGPTPPGLAGAIRQWLVAQLAEPVAEPLQSLAAPDDRAQPDLPPRLIAGVADKLQGDRQCAG